jgi:hypothetical protein
VLRLAVPGFLIVILCLAPFLNKAYTIDDPMFLLSARQILHSPLQPMSFERCWEPIEPCGMIVGRVGAGAAQSLMGYLLAPVVLVGSREWMAHLLQILIACLAVWGTVGLALRLGLDRIQASLAGVMLAAIPPFLPVTSSIMPDTLSGALGVAGMERLLAWKSERRFSQGLMAGILLGLAGYARPHAALLLALAVFWLLEDFRLREMARDLRQAIRLVIPVLFAACLLLSLILLTWDRTGAAVPKNLLIGSSHLGHNLYSYFLYFCFPIPLAPVWLITRAPRSARLWAGLPVVFVAILHLKFSPSQSIFEEWAKLAACLGLIGLVHAVRTSICRNDRVGMLLSFWLLIPLPLIVYDHLAIKYYLVVLPAVSLILMRCIALLPRSVGFALCGTMAIGFTAYSCLAVRADVDFAEYGRTAAAEFVAPHVAQGEHVWYAGIAGFYWYAAEAGAKVARPDQPGPASGDLLAVAVAEGGDVTRDRYPNRELLAVHKFRAPHGRTVGARGALYSNFDGDAIWVWSPDTTSNYELWRIH